jgi:hypothetical protein
VRLLLFLLVSLSVPASSQPKIGVIDFYGERKVSTDKLRKSLGVKESDPLPPSKLDLEERLDKIGDVVQSHVEAVCCSGTDAVLYAGIEEKGAPHFETRGLESGEDLKLPAPEDIEGLREVLRKADEASVRADAAALLGEAKVSQAVVEDLQYAARDFDPLVRKAAVRGLVKMSMAARTATPDDKLFVLPTWIIEMLNSVVWSDRNSASDALMELTDSRDPTLLGKIRERAFDSLLQMAQWKFLPHALPPYLLLCRVSGIPDQEAQSEWSAGNRDKMIARIRKESRK